MAEFPAHRNLVISPVGDKSQHRTWVAGPMERQFDLMLIYFGDRPDFDFNGAEFAQRRKGFKFSLLHWATDEFDSLLANYDRIWCPDDDIAADTKTINQMFKIFDEYELDLAQPAISAGEVSYEALRQAKSTTLRYSPYVEVMCPLFTREAFLKTRPLFLETQSGWGIDWVWSKWFPREKVAILDACGVHHTGVLMKGDLYQKLKARGIDPFQEFDDCVARHGGIDRRIHKRMVRGTMPMQRVPLAGQELSWWEKTTGPWRWAA